MALTDEGGNTGMVMPVSPMYGGNGGGFGGFGNDWGWIILLLHFAGGGWGGGFGGANNFAADGAMLYPWMNQSNQIGDGFRDQMLNTTINGIQNSVTAGFGGVENSLCAGFAGVNATINNTQMAAYSVQKNKKQTVNIPVGNDDPNVQQLIKTGIGNGQIQQMSIRLTSRTAKTQFRYDTE